MRDMRSPTLICNNNRKTPNENSYAHILILCYFGKSSPNRVLSSRIFILIKRLNFMKFLSLVRLGVIVQHHISEVFFANLTEIIFYFNLNKFKNNKKLNT